MKPIRVNKTLPVIAVWFKDHASNDVWGAEPEGGLEEILAVGLLTHQDAEKIVIARMVGTADREFEGTLTIHVACITKVQRLWASPIAARPQKEQKNGA